MKKKSNLQSVKDVALIFLEQPIKETPISPVIVQHPIFENGITSIEDKDGIKMINLLEDKEALEQLIERYKKRINSRDSISSVFSIIRKSYRLTFLKYIEPYLSKCDMSELLADAWVSSENPNQDVNCSLPMIIKWFKKSDKLILMDENEYKVYKELPDSFEIYRGVAVNRNPKGLSWTRNKSTAEWFSKRFNNKKNHGYIQCATIKKENVLAYFDSRGEDEIVVDISKVNDIKII